MAAASTSPAARLWDCLVIGAGPAGCAAAYDLAVAGRQVLLVDKAVFPRGKACAGGLTMKAVRALRYPIDPVVRRWVSSIVLEEAGLQEPGLQEAGQPAGPSGGARSLTVGRRTPVCAMTLREELDSFCLARTMERGAVFQRIAAIAAIEPQGDRVFVRLQDGGQLQARFVVGADGVHSRVRALTASADASWFRSGFAIECNVPYLAGEQWPLTFDFAPVKRGYGWLFPRDAHVNVGLYVEQHGAPADTVDRAALDRYIASRFGAGRLCSKPVGQFLGLGAARYQPAPGTQVLLAGDAAGFVDPLTGEGIYGAIRSGQAAAAAIDAALGGGGHSGHSRLEPGMPPGQGFAHAARALQADLAVAEHAATRFFAAPAAGFQLMRLPLVPRAVLHCYAEGLRLAPLLRGMRLVRRGAGLFRGAQRSAG